MLDLNYAPKKVVDTEGMPYDLWKEYRTKGIGGSDVAAIFNESPWTTARTLYFNKIGIQLEEPDAINQYTLDFGHAIEPFVAEYFNSSFENRWKKWLESNLGKKIDKFEIYKDTFMYKHPNYPFMQANLDYRWKVITNTGEIIEGIFECKSTNYRAGPDKWKGDETPPYYTYQVRHYMSVMNLSATIIACLWGNNENDYVARFVSRDFEEEERIINAEYEFWHNNVLARRAPELSENGTMEMEAMKKYGIAHKLKQLPELVIPSQKAVKTVSEYLKLDEERANMEKMLKSVIARRDKKKVDIICSVGDNEMSIIKGKKTKSYIIENKRIYRTTVDGKALLNDMPDVYNNYSKVSASMQFKVKPIN